MATLSCGAGRARHARHLASKSTWASDAKYLTVRGKAASDYGLPRLVLLDAPIWLAEWKVPASLQCVSAENGIGNAEMSAAIRTRHQRRNFARTTVVTSCQRIVHFAPQSNAIQNVRAFSQSPTERTRTLRSSQFWRADSRSINWTLASLMESPTRGQLRLDIESRLAIVCSSFKLLSGARPSHCADLTLQIDAALANRSLTN